MNLHGRTAPAHKHKLGALAQLVVAENNTDIALEGPHASSCVFVSSVRSSLCYPKAASSSSRLATNSSSPPAPVPARVTLSGPPDAYFRQSLVIGSGSIRAARQLPVMCVSNGAYQFVSLLSLRTSSYAGRIAGSETSSDMDVWVKRRAAGTDLAKVKDDGCYFAHSALDIFSSHDLVA